MNTGVYKITNLITNQLYIGSAAGKTGFKRRFETHKYQLRRNISPCVILQNSWNKYGEENFKFEILEKCTPEYCIKREQYFIDTLNPYLNVLKTAGNRLGSKHTKESRRKISEKMKGKPANNKGVSPSKEAIEKQRAKMIGRKASEKTKEKIRLSKIGANNPQAKKTYCIELNMTFDSACIAANFIRNNMNPKAAQSAISACCRGDKYKTAYGLTWKYL